jgi:hypothetical protein
MRSVTLDEEADFVADCTVIATGHCSYDWPWILSRSRLVMDARNETGSVSSNRARVMKL